MVRAALAAYAFCLSPGRANKPRPPYGLQVDEFEAMYEQSQTPSHRILGFDTAFPAPPPASAGTRPSPAPLVSVDQLRHPLTAKARRFLAKAFRYAERGDHAHAISTLQRRHEQREPLSPPTRTHCWASNICARDANRKRFRSLPRPPYSFRTMPWCIRISPFPCASWVSTRSRGTGDQTGAPPGPVAALRSRAHAHDRDG